MPIYINARELPFTIVVTDGTLDEVALAVKQWQESNGRIVFHVGDAGQFVVQFGLLSVVSLTTVAGGSPGDADGGLKPEASIRIHND